MYIRIKKRKTKSNSIDYAYETKSIRTIKGPRQKVLSYLGKVLYLNKQDLSLNSYLNTNDIESYFKDKNLKQIVKELLIFELIRHNFFRQDNILKKDGIFVNIEDKLIKSINGSKIVLGINKGFLCSKTLKKCFEDIEKISDTKKLIKSLLLIGLDSDESTFTKIFRHKI